MTLSADEFLRRFVQHVLPKGFPRIRYFGWMANRKRENCFLSAAPAQPANTFELRNLDIKPAL